MQFWNHAWAFIDAFPLAGLVRYLIPLAVCLLVLALGRIVERTGNALLKKVPSLGADWGKKTAAAGKRPLRMFFLCTGLYAALNLFPNIQQYAALLASTTKIYRSVLVMLVAWVFCNLECTDNLRTSAFAKRMDAQSNRGVLPILSKAMRFLTVALAALIIAQEWSFSISGLLAGLGLGGLAVSLAAKNLLASILGGLIILLDKPFKIGDWVEIASIEGTVEDITFRSVKIRTFTQALVTIPNAVVVDTPVTNWSRMGKRRVVLHLELDAKTPPPALRTAKEAVLHYVRECKGIHPETVTVSFDDVTGAGLLFAVVYFTRTTKWETFLKIREDVLLNTLQLLEDHHVPLAAPVRQVRLREDEP